MFKIIKNPSLIQSISSKLTAVILSIINDYGKDQVKSYIESKGRTQSSPAKRWELFSGLLGNEVTLMGLEKDGK